MSVVLQCVILLHFKVKLPSPSLKYYLAFCGPVWLGWLHSHSSSLNSSDANMLLSPSVTCLSTWHMHFLICLNLGQDYASNSMCFWMLCHFTLQRAPADDSIWCAIQQSHHSAWSQVVALWLEWNWLINQIQEYLASYAVSIHLLRTLKLVWRPPVNTVGCFEQLGSGLGTYPSSSSSLW